MKKQSIKQFLFNNFENEISKASTKNSLTIRSIYNLTTKNNFIEPTQDVYPLTKRLITKSKYNEFLSNNLSFLNEVAILQSYEYFDNSSNLFKLRLFAITKDLYLFEYNETLNLFVTTNLKFLSKPKIFHKDNCLYFYSTNDMLITIENSNLYHLSNPANITDYYVFDNNIYFLIENQNFKVYYTESTQLYNIPSNLNNSYSLDLNPEDGKVLKLVSINEKLYIVQQYKILKINKKQDNCYISDVLNLNSKVKQDTICSLNENIVFCSEYNIFVFDGNDIHEIFNNIVNDLDFKTVQCVAFNNKYYMKTKILVNMNYESVLIEFNIDSNSCEIYKIDNLDNIYVLKSPNIYLIGLCTNTDNIRNVLTLNPARTSTHDKYIKFNNITFDNNNLKFLKSIRFKSFGKFKLTISSEYNSLTFYIGDNFEINNISLEGHSFDIEIESIDTFYIESIYIEVLEQLDFYD